jgi:hypothetical protein
MVMACLKRRPDDRPHDAFALLEMINHCAAGLGIRAGEGSLAPSARLDTGPSSPLPAAAGHGVSAPPVGTVAYGSEGAKALREAALAAMDVNAAREALGWRGATSMPPPPRIGEGSPANLVQSWRSHYEDVERRLEPYAQRRVLPTMIEQALERRTQLLELLERTAQDIVETQETLDKLATRGRDFRATLGRAIDHIGRDLSRAHGKVLELKARRVDLHLKRRHTEDPGAADAILWEEAAIDSDMRRAVAVAADLGHQLGTLQDELFARNNAHEAEALRATGILEGESAALSTLHRELELLSGEIASFLASR